MCADEWFKLISSNRMLKVRNKKKKNKAHKSYKNDVSNIRYAKSYLDELIIAIDRDVYG